LSNKSNQHKNNELFHVSNTSNIISFFCNQ
jgi:hypothetical protein